MGAEETTVGDILAQLMDPQNPVLGFAQLPDGTPIVVDSNLVQGCLATHFTYFLPNGRPSGQHIISDGNGNSVGEVALREALPEGFALEQYLESHVGNPPRDRITFAAFGNDNEGLVIGGSFDTIEEAVQAARDRMNTLAPPTGEGDEKPEA